MKQSGHKKNFGRRITIKIYLYYLSQIKETNTQSELSNPIFSCVCFTNVPK